MQTLMQIVERQPLLAIFLILAVGTPLGRLRWRGLSLGPAAVLFVGLFAGAVDHRFRIPKEIQELGLAIFVYTVGLASGPGFFASFRRQGLRDNLFVAAALLAAAGLVVGLASLSSLRPALVAGTFAGAFTNTPGLAAALEYLSQHPQAGAHPEWASDPAVGYSMAYPMGVLGMVAAIALAQTWWKIDYPAELQGLRDKSACSQRLLNRTLRVLRPTGDTLDALVHQHGWDVVFGRLKRDGKLQLVRGGDVLQADDRLSAVGAPEDLERVAAVLGEWTDEHLELDRSQLDFRRIFVSNPKVAGHCLRTLNLPQQFGAVVTRIRRGDLEFLPHADTVLELGDRVRVVARPESLAAVSKFFGDSYRSLSEVDVLSFSLGLAVGLLLGAIPFPTPGGGVLKLGFAGGPLVVALILGTLERSGGIVWTLPYSANLTLRQLGLVLFLAGVGSNAGQSFYLTLAHSPALGAAIFAVGAAATFTTAFAFLFVGYKILHIPFGWLIGLLAGLQTQPALLAFASEQTQDESPNLGYAVVFPAAMVVKILLCQAIVAWGLAGV